MSVHAVKPPSMHTKPAHAHVAGPAPHAAGTPRQLFQLPVTSLNDSTHIWSLLQSAQSVTTSQSHAGTQAPVQHWAATSGSYPGGQFGGNPLQSTSKGSQW